MDPGNAANIAERSGENFLNDLNSRKVITIQFKLCTENEIVHKSL